MYYHILVSTEETDKIFESDHENIDYIIENMAKPYLKNNDFQVDGYFIEPAKVKRMMITKTERDSNTLLDNAYDEAPAGFVIHKEECVFERDEYREDITREVFEEIKKELSQNDDSEKDDEPVSGNSTTIFLAYSYREEDEEFVSGFKKLLKNQGYKVIDGKADRLGSVSEAIVEKIQISDITVVVMTKRDKKENGKFTTAAWLLEEKGAAIALNKKVAMFVEEGVDEADIGGLQGDDQRFHFTRNNFLEIAMNFIKIIESSNK